MWGYILILPHLIASPRTELTSRSMFSLWSAAPWGSSLGSLSSVGWRLSIFSSRLFSVGLKVSKNLKCISNAFRSIQNMIHTQNYSYNKSKVCKSDILRYDRISWLSSSSHQVFFSSLFQFYLCILLNQKHSCTHEKLICQMTKLRTGRRNLLLDAISDNIYGSHLLNMIHFPNVWGFPIWKYLMISDKCMLMFIKIPNERMRWVNKHI